MNKVCSNRIIDSLKDAFGLTIFWGGVGARKPELHAMFDSMLVKKRVVELTSIIA